MGKALFTLFAVFVPLFGQGAEEPSFTGRGGPFLHAPARTNYRSPPKVRAWRAFLNGRWGAVFYQGLAASGEEGHFTRYFTLFHVLPMGRPNGNSVKRALSMGCKLPTK